MLVSEFEIRRHDHERQHYRLSVTNLEDQDFEYSIEFHAEQSSGASHGFASLVRLSFTVDEPFSEDTIVFLRNPPRCSLTAEDVAEPRGANTLTPESWRPRQCATKT